VRPEVPDRDRAPRRLARTREKYPRSAQLVLIERRAMREPVMVELEPGERHPTPAGFWRGARFHGVVRVLERRAELGATYLRVLADRGCYDLRRLTVADPRTWRTEARWELIAELAAIPVSRRSP
jgi:hypothetical protein